MGPLAEVRVLDFTGHLAGGVSTLVLAFMGAEVIKVESRAHLDLLRIVPHPFVGPSPTRQADSLNSDVFVAVNLNKLSITLNLKLRKAVELAKKLVGISDLVAENFRPGVMDRLGLGYATLRDIKPDIVMLSESGHGGSGPEQSYRGYAGIYSALSGIGELVGYPGQPPTDTRSSADYRAGLYGALAALAGLVYRQRAGHGQYIDSSMRESNTMVIGEAIMDYTMNGRNQSRTGNRDEVMAPHNCYRCRGEDQWITIAIATDEEWKALCGAMGNPGWCKDGRFADQDGRWRNQEQLDRLIEGWTASHDPFELMGVLQKAGVAAAPSFSCKDLFDDPHLKSRGAFCCVEHPELGGWYSLRPPWRLSRTPAKIARSAPLLGQHNDYVFSRLLGLAPAEIARLVEEQVIY